MAAATISIEMAGYWRDINKGRMPAKPGIYCVYECTFEEVKKSVSIHKLIYIGEAANAQARVANHEKHQDWLERVGRGNVLCFSFGEVGGSNRERAEAVLIYKHKPLENSEYTESFPFDKTTISLSGITMLLEKYFKVYRT